MLETAQCPDARLSRRTCVRYLAGECLQPVHRSALERGSLTGVRAAVANLAAPPPLDDALAICLLLLEQEPDRYERGAVRWLGRLLLERRGVGLRDAELAAAYLAASAHTARRDAATEALAELGRTVGLPRLGERIAPAGGD
jgi:hypothetical protein